jgi:hypothetical protein
MYSAHPKPWLDRLTQYGAVVMLVFILVSVPVQLVLALTGLSLFAWTAIFTLLLGPFVLLLTVATPAVSLSAEGLTIQPMIWKTRFVPWSAVKAVKPYPLLPPPDTEISRQHLSGRKNYRPAAGMMLVLPDLPLPYRVTGVLAGEGFIPVIAITNRTHTGYDRLVKQIRKHVGESENDAAKEP